MPLGEPEKQVDWTGQPERQAQAQMLGYTGNFKMDLHLASLAKSHAASVWGLTADKRDAMVLSPIVLLHTRLPQIDIIHVNRKYV